MAKEKTDFVVVRRRAYDDLGYQQTQDKNPRKLETSFSRKDRARFRKPCESETGTARFKTAGAAEKAAQRVIENTEFAEYYNYSVEPVPRESADPFGSGWF